MRSNISTKNLAIKFSKHFVITFSCLYVFRECYQFCKTLMEAVKKIDSLEKAILSKKSILDEIQPLFNGVDYIKSTVNLFKEEFSENLKIVIDNQETLKTSLKSIEQKIADKDVKSLSSEVKNIKTILSDMELFQKDLKTVIDNQKKMEVSLRNIFAQTIVGEDGNLYHVEQKNIENTISKFKEMIEPQKNNFLLHDIQLTTADIFSNEFTKF